MMNQGCAGESSGLFYLISIVELESCCSVCNYLKNKVRKIKQMNILQEQLYGIKYEFNLIGNRIQNYLLMSF